MIRPGFQRIARMACDMRFFVDSVNRLFQLEHGAERARRDGARRLSAYFAKGVVAMESRGSSFGPSVTKACSEKAPTSTAVAMATDAATCSKRPDRAAARTPSRVVARCGVLFPHGPCDVRRPALVVMMRRLRIMTGMRPAATSTRDGVEACANRSSEARR